MNVKVMTADYDEDSFEDVHDAMIVEGGLWILSAPEKIDFAYAAGAWRTVEISRDEV